jgi:histone deacetylase 6
MTPEEILDSETYYDQLSLYVMQGTTRAARLSCGGVIEACLAVARDELKKTFAIVRPPGHHAEPDEHMGFCLFNNVAVGARVVQQLTPLKRIMILDWLVCLHYLHCMLMMRVNDQGIFITVSLDLCV